MELLEEVKNYLDITWQTTSEEDKKLLGMIERGKAALSGKLGTVILRKKLRKRHFFSIM